MNYPVCAIALSGVGLLLASCQTAPSQSAPLEAIHNASGSGALIAYRSEMPVDEQVSGDTLSLIAAVKQGLESDPALQAALARVRIAAADADQARLLPNPVLNFILRWGPGKPQFEISLAQDFIEILTMPKRVGAADNRLREASARAVAVALDSLERIQLQYADAQAASEMTPLLEARLALLDKLTATAQDRLDSGEGTREEVTSLRARRAQVAIDLRDARVNQQRQRLQLTRLIGEPSGEASWTLDALAPAAINPADEKTWVASALEHQPELQAISWRLAALGDNLALARASVWQGASLGVDSQRDDAWFTGPSISTPIPIFDTGKARSDRARAEIMEARHDFTLAARTSIEQTRVALRTLVAANETLASVQNDLLPLERSRLELARESLIAGYVDASTLILAEEDLRLAEIRELETRRLAARSLAQLQRAAGGPGIATPLLATGPSTSFPASNTTNPSTETTNSKTDSTESNK
ncbi:MAG: TolC family protein [Planctomycetes bacterium]|nr:TolC family protein [Planctomycetota bacterium]